MLGEYSRIRVRTPKRSASTALREQVEVLTASAKALRSANSQLEIQVTDLQKVALDEADKTG